MSFKRLFSLIFFSDISTRQQETKNKWRRNLYIWHEKENTEPTTPTTYPHTKCFLSNIYWDVEFGFLNSIEDGLKRIGECYMESVLRNIELSTVYILGRIADTETHSITGWKPWKISIAASCNALLLYSIFVVIRSCFD